MCTVTFIPKKRGFILTSNRDEVIDRARKVHFPEIVSFDEESLIFPKDLQGGGTWIAGDNKGKVAVLLNGGFKAHKRKSTYRKSRGLVVLDSFGYDDAKSFSKQYDFSEIEPFTLILLQYNKGKSSINQLVWDGAQPHLKKLNNTEPAIWSSSTLYNEATRKQRNEWFGDFLKRGDFTVFGARKFHEFGGNGDPSNTMNMKRANQLATVSITSIEFDDRGGEFTYQDLLENTTSREFL